MSCIVSPLETICMKCYFFLGEITYFTMLFAENFTQHFKPYFANKSYQSFKSYSAFDITWKDVLFLGVVAKPPPDVPCQISTISFPVTTNKITT